GQQRADFTRLVNAESSGGEDGVWDLKELPWDQATWADDVQAERSSVQSCFPDFDERVAESNRCLASMYVDGASDLGNHLAVTRDGSQVTLSGFSDSLPNWVDYEDIEGANITLDPEGWVPSTDAPLIIRVNSPTDTIGPVNIQGWSANNDREQDYSRYILLDASQATSPLTIDGLELGAVWAPGIDVEFTGSRSTNGQWLAQNILTQGGGEIRHHTFAGRLLCRSAAEPATFSIHKEIEGDAAGRVPDDAEFTVRWTVNAGPNAGLSGDLVVRADGTVVDGPELAAGDEVSFEETARPSVSGVEWEGVTIDPASITLDSSAPVVDVTVTNIAEEPPDGPSPTETPTEPTETPTEPTETPTEPTETPTEPTGTPTGPTESPTDPTEAPTDPTDPPTEPTESPGDPTGSPTDPSDPTAGPPDSPGGPDDPNLPWTGFDAHALLTGAVLLAVGIVLVITGKKRRREE